MPYSKQLPTHPSETNRALRVLGSLICFLAAAVHIWSKFLFTKAHSHFQEALGDNYLKKLPDLTRFTLEAYQSVYWPLGLWLPYIILIALWMIRPAWLIAVLSGCTFIWTLAFLCVVPLSFWLSDMMILQVILVKAKENGLLPD
jgi:hypothetical protein